MGGATRALLQALVRTGSYTEELRRHLVSAVVHQSTLFPVAEPTVRVLLPRCRSDVALSSELEEFWTEWKEGVQMVDAGPTVTPEQRSAALSTIASMLDEEQDADDVLERLYEDASDGTPIDVLHRYTYQRARIAMPEVERLMQVATPERA